MIRSTNLIQNNTLVRNVQRHQIKMDQLNAQLSTGRRIRTPADDPAGATNQMFFRTRVEELEQFERNIYTATARLNLMDGELQRVSSIFQRVRELTVQASNGIYQGDNGFELKHAIAKEIDQHLRALIEIANGRDAVGDPLFGGHVVGRPPFEPIESNIRGTKGLTLTNQIINVEYRGDIGRRLSEVERDQYIDVNLAGSNVFWGTNMTVTGDVDNSGYVATTDQSFTIDGSEIRVAAGDTIDDIIDKVNNANLQVRASKIGQDNISLHTTSPHKLWLEDSGGGTVLRDIGLINSNKPNPPNNYSPTARVSGLSVFDTLIKLRNDLLSKDQLQISGRDLGNLDEAFNNILSNLAEVGSRQRRLDEHTKRVTWDKVYMQELLAKNEGIDFPETIMNLRWMETVHNYALNVGARIIKPTLMDFMR